MSIWAGIGGAVLSGAASLTGAREANEQNWKRMQWQQEQNERIHRADINWKEWMSNTAHQREVKDLEAAGLNPLLSIQGGGASTPGSSAVTGSAIGAQDEMSGAVNSAIQAMALDTSLKKQKQEISNMKAAKKKIAAESKAIAAKEKLDQAQTASVKQFQTIKGPLERGADTVNYLFDSLGNPDSKFKKKKDKKRQNNGVMIKRRN